MNDLEQRIYDAETHSLERKVHRAKESLRVAKRSLSSHKAGQTLDVGCKGLGQRTTNLLKEGRKIQAIHKWRSHFNVSLKEARTRVEQIEGSLLERGQL